MSAARIQLQTAREFPLDPQLEASRETAPYAQVIDEICDLNWSALSRDELIDVA